MGCFRAPGRHDLGPGCGSAGRIAFAQRLLRHNPRLRERRLKASGAPWNALASYKSAPAGLAWKNKVLSGVPTKTGGVTYKTTAGEPVRLSVLALSAGAKGTFNGVLASGTGKLYPLKFSATAAGKLAAVVTKGSKTYSLSASKWGKVQVESVNGVPHRMFFATLTASGLSLSVKVDADAAWNEDALTAVGTLGAVKGLAGSAQRNVYATDVDAAAAVATLAGTQSLSAVSDGVGVWALTKPEDGMKGALTIVLNESGTAKISGTLPDKKKVNASSVLHVNADGEAYVRFYVGGVWIVWQPSAVE